MNDDVEVKIYNYIESIREYLEKYGYVSRISILDFDKFLEDNESIFYGKLI